jgi:histidine ammonia-lyase
MTTTNHNLVTSKSMGFGPAYSQGSVCAMMQEYLNEFNVSTVTGLVQ